MSDFQGKNVVITGGGSGIGQAIALEFARQGAAVRILELSEASAAQTLQAIAESAGEGSAQAFGCDVSRQGEVHEVISKIIDRDGKLDILVNCAGVAHVGTLQTTSEADFDRIFSVNVKGVYNCMHASISQMVAQGGGVILNMASIAATVGIPDRFAYSMSKGAVMTMTLSVARDYIGKNIRCNSISPARVHTPFVDGFLAKNYPGREAEMFQTLSRTQPIGRMAEPREIARLTLFLCSEDAAFITGSDYPIDGGFIRLNN
jgi:NAD(P)-dependent dehydrogenase (short-subunit alcohol dehydrogenase family)